MANNSRKTPFVFSLAKFARNQIDLADELDGMALPCHVVAVSGQIVTVAFDIDSSFTLPQVKCPIYGAEYIRFPTQVGDKGVVIAADAYLGGISGLGVGTATLLQPGNLSALIFLPIGNKNWVSVDPNAVTIYGPNGVVLRDTSSGTVVTVTPEGASMTHGGASITVNESGVAITGTLTINGVPYLGHQHSGVQSGGSNTGGVA